MYSMMQGHRGGGHGSPGSLRAASDAGVRGDHADAASGGGDAAVNVGRVFVAARVRPPVPATDGPAVMTRCNRVEARPPSKTLIVHPPPAHKLKEARGFPAEPQEAKKFTYDAVFGEQAGQAEVYRASVAPAVLDVLAGSNAVVLCYGQTGAGKTHTIFGPDVDVSRVTAQDAGLLGVLPRAMHDLFERLDARYGDWRAAKRHRPGAPLEPPYSVSVQYLQLYCDTWVDLLAHVPTGHGSAASSKAAGGAALPWGASRHPASGVREILALLHAGVTKKATATTALNAASSRGHTVFHVTVSTRGLVDGGAVSPSTSSLSFFDLAGSERVATSGTMEGGIGGARFSETRAINKSLSALGVVLGAVATALMSKAAAARAAAAAAAASPYGLIPATPPSAAASFVPWRTSKLTHFLRGALAGTGAAASARPASITLILCVSPVDDHAQETLATCQWGARTQAAGMAVAGFAASAAALLGAGPAGAAAAAHARALGGEGAANAHTDEHGDGGVGGSRSGSPSRVSPSRRGGGGELDVVIDRQRTQISTLQGQYEALMAAHAKLLSQVQVDQKERNNMESTLTALLSQLVAGGAAPPAPAPAPASPVAPAAAAPASPPPPPMAAPPAPRRSSLQQLEDNAAGIVEARGVERAAAVAPSASSASASGSAAPSLAAAKAALERARSVMARLNTSSTPVVVETVPEPAPVAEAPAVSVAAPVAAPAPLAPTQLSTKTASLGVPPPPALASGGVDGSGIGASAPTPRVPLGHRGSISGASTGVVPAAAASTSGMPLPRPSKAGTGQLVAPAASSAPALPQQQQAPQPPATPVVNAAAVDALRSAAWWTDVRRGLTLAPLGGQGDGTSSAPPSRPASPKAEPMQPPPPPPPPQMLAQQGQASDDDRSDASSQSSAEERRRRRHRRSRRSSSKRHGRSSSRHRRHNDRRSHRHRSSSSTDSDDSSSDSSSSWSSSSSSASRRERRRSSSRGRAGKAHSRKQQHNDSSDVFQASVSSYGGMSSVQQASYRGLAASPAREGAQRYQPPPPPPPSQPTPAAETPLITPARRFSMPTAPSAGSAVAPGVASGTRDGSASYLPEAAHTLPATETTTDDLPGSAFTSRAGASRFLLGTADEASRPPLAPGGGAGRMELDATVPASGARTASRGRTPAVTHAAEAAPAAPSIVTVTGGAPGRRAGTLPESLRRPRPYLASNEENPKGDATVAAGSGAGRVALSEASAERRSASEAALAAAASRASSASRSASAASSASFRPPVASLNKPGESGASASAADTRRSSSASAVPAPAPAAPAPAAPHQMVMMMPPAPAGYPYPMPMPVYHPGPYGAPPGYYPPMGAYPPPPGSGPEAHPGTPYGSWGSGWGGYPHGASAAPQQQQGEAAAKPADKPASDSMGQPAKADAKSASDGAKATPASASGPAAEAKPAADTAEDDADDPLSAALRSTKAALANALAAINDPPKSSSNSFLPPGVPPTPASKAAAAALASPAAAARVEAAGMSQDSLSALVAAAVSSAIAAVTGGSSGSVPASPVRQAPPSAAPPSAPRPAAGGASPAPPGARPPPARPGGAASPAPPGARPPPARPGVPSTAAPPATPAPQASPWVKYTDKNSGKPYWHNKSTGVTTWSDPTPPPSARPPPGSAPPAGPKPPGAAATPTPPGAAPPSAPRPKPPSSAAPTPPPARRASAATEDGSAGDGSAAAAPPSGPRPTPPPSRPPSAPASPAPSRSGSVAGLPNEGATAEGTAGAAAPRPPSSAPPRPPPARKPVPSTQPEGATPTTPAPAPTPAASSTVGKPSSAPASSAAAAPSPAAAGGGVDPEIAAALEALQAQRQALAEVLASVNDGTLSPATMTDQELLSYAAMLHPLASAYPNMLLLSHEGVPVDPALLATASDAYTRLLALREEGYVVIGDGM